MNLNELKKWLKIRLENKGRKSMSISIRNSKNIQKALIKHTTFLPENSKLTRRAYHVLNDLVYIPKCKTCENEVSYSHRTESWGYLDHCSIKCSVNDPDVIEKKINTTTKVWGADNISKTKYFKEKFKEVMLDRYGVTHNFQMLDKSSYEKRLRTIKERYGDGNYPWEEKRRKAFLKTIQPKIDERNKTLNERELYYKTVWSFTNESLFIHGNDKFGSDWKERRGNKQFHIDHVYSIYDGFENNVPPYIIGNINNLQLIWHVENRKKGSKSNITLNELIQLL